LSGRGCPLCDEQAWDFDGMRIVVLVDAEMPERVSQQRFPWGGARNPEEGLVGRIFEEADIDNRLIQISCDNCGHAELLDACKLTN
jgi:hypothetical protein